MESRIYYFCYGSNLLTKRMHVNNKSAIKFANGILRNYKLSFSGNSKVWKGATANIIPDPKSLVHGAVYTLSKADIDNLDRQEIGYNALDVEVELPDNNPKLVTCRTYVQKENYEKSDDQKIPSKLYKQVIIKGAEEQQLPQSYIENVIKSFPDNGIVDCGPPGFEL